MLKTDENGLKQLKMVENGRKPLTMVEIVDNVGNWLKTVKKLLKTVENG